MRIIGRAFSVFGLADKFRHEVADLVKAEVKLAKVEMSEKAAILKKSAISFGIGIFVTFAGLIVLSLALGRLLALAYAGFGMARDMANFLGIVTAGLVVAIVGGIFLMKAVKSFSTTSLKPEKTIETIRDLRGDGHHRSEPPKPEEPAKPQPSKQELEARIDYSRHELKQTIARARRRAAIGSAAMIFGRQMRRHPMRTLVLGACAGLASRALKRRRANGV